MCAKNAVAFFRCLRHKTPNFLHHSVNTTNNVNFIKVLMKVTLLVPFKQVSRFLLYTLILSSPLPIQHNINSPSHVHLIEQISTSDTINTSSILGSHNCILFPRNIT